MPKDKNQILTPEEIDVQDASDQEQELTLEEQYAQLLLHLRFQQPVGGLTGPVLPL